MGRRLWLCLPAAGLCLLDGALTLAGQDAAYWAGTPGAANEANPVGYLLLEWHPLAFVAGVLAWAALFCGAALWLPRPLPALVVLVALGHAVGAATWLAIANWPWPAGLVAAGVLLVVADAVIGYGWRRYRSVVPRSGDPQRRAGECVQ